ncbi:MacB-like core domain-containing protein [Ruminococcaceae bacterium FB2012]|nr:MacB-like core domain-containing protein [Ruminococcaceae bacterium FB2012]
MSILGRLTRRNIFGKPLRSAAIVIALAASSFALLFCIEGREAPAQQVRNNILRAYAGAEVLAMDTGKNLSIKESDLPEGGKLLLTASTSGEIVTGKGTYNVIFRGSDPKLHAEFGFNDTVLDPKDGAIISQNLAEKSGLKAGDTVTVKREDVSFELTVTEVSGDKYLRNYPNRITVSVETVKKLDKSEGTGFNIGYADLPDELDAAAVSADLQKKYPDHAITPVLSDEMVDEINNQTTVFYLIFASILLMTLFLTSSMSRHIANERLAVIGTLRSLGGSLRRTSKILLTESAVYGLAGGVLGAVGFYFAGDLAVDAMFGGNTSQNYEMPLWMYPAAAAAAVVIQLACQSGALIKAVKTPVRDIIFSSRDTAYRLSGVKIIIGLMIFSAGIVLGMLAEEMTVTIGAVALICVGAVTLLPIVLWAVSHLLVKLFALLGMPCAKLAAGELRHKKSTVTGTQLTFVALTITTAIFITVQSVMRIYQAEVYNFDARINANITEEEFGFISEMPEVTEMEHIYSEIINGGIDGGKKHYLCIAAYNDYKLFTSIRGLGDEPSADEAYIGRTVAEKYGLGTGDSFEITDYNNYVLNEDGSSEYYVYKFKVKGICDTVDHFNETVVVNKGWFREEIRNKPDYTYIRLRQPSDFAAVRDKLNEVRPNDSIITAESLKQEDEEDMSSIMTILYGITAVGCVLALLGAVNSAVIGFEQSKRKYAVLHSVAAGKRKLSRLILLETLISSAVAGGLALLAGLLLSSLIKNAMTDLGMGIEVVYNIPLTSAFVGVMIFVLLLAAVKPIVSLCRMNTAAELKYE